MNTLELKQYYQKLLIDQYLNFTKASGQVGVFAGQAILPQISLQTIVFESAPASGTFVISYDGESSAAINWNDSSATIQTKLRAITGLSSVTVVGEISTLLLTITFTGVTPPAFIFVVESNSLGVLITITETDITLPLAVQNAFNLFGDNIAVGDQLDTIAKYVGVTRTGRSLFDPNVNITLDDEDFLTLIHMGIIRNSAGSSLATIQDFIYQFFGTSMLVYDSTLMFLSFIISEGVGPQELIELFITEGLLPVPMAVGYAVIYGPGTAYFSFCTYEHTTIVNGFPFNTYEDYDLNSPWLTYENVIYP